MSHEKQFDWLDIATQLKAISQAGKTFAKDDYEKKRHEQIEDIAAQILAQHTQLSADETKMLLQEDTGYPTPKVDCRAVVFRDNKILLVKEIADGGWTLPGGWCDVGSTPTENVIRETREESGFEVKVDRLLAVYDRDRQGHTPPYPFSIYKMFFLCTITGGSAQTSNETSEVAFFAEDRIPELSIGRTLPKQLQRFFAEHRTGEYTIEYD